MGCIFEWMFCLGVCNICLIFLLLDLIFCGGDNDEGGLFLVGEEIFFIGMWSCFLFLDEDVVEDNLIKFEGIWDIVMVGIFVELLGVVFICELFNWGDSRLLVVMKWFGLFCMLNNLFSLGKRKREDI